jgi:dTDP-4-amino-4,6-dideoxygalactose transaminase
MQFIDLKAQYQHLKEKIDTRIQTVLDHGKFILGPEVQEIEEKLSEYVGVKHTIGVANGTDALQLALMALGVGEGDAVFVPTFTFFASAEVIPLVGATPVFIDIDENTYNICLQSLKRAIDQTIKDGINTPKAIIAVDLFGLPANYPAIQEIADNYGLKVIEDAAQGFGGALDDKKTGSFGDIATTSFFPAKPLGCYGDGGAVFTNNDDLASMIRSLRVHGKGMDKYDNIRIGLNSRLDTIQAAILIEKLSAFPHELNLRQNIAKIYSGALNKKYHCPIVPSGYTSSWAQYTIRAKKGGRDEPMVRLKENGIPSLIYYRKNMHEQTAFKNFGNSIDNLLVAEEMAKSVFSLPMHPYMQETDQQIIIDKLCSI